MATRMKDIARDLGVSVMTVSKALRNHSDIGAETRKRVLKRIKELNYTPNAAARALVTGRSNVVGLIVPDLVHSFFAELAKGLSAVLRRQGYSLVISSSEEDPELERAEIDHLLARGVDVLIVASVQTATDGFRRIQTPYVLIDRRFPRLAANFIGVDDELVGRLATRHLVEIGCRRIAYIGGTRLSSATGRLKGYRQALAEHRIKVPPGFAICRPHADDFADAVGYEAVQWALGLPSRPDAFFCQNDPIAMGAMSAILDAGLDIPGDVAVVGCGDVHYAKFLRVPLSSVAQQSEAMGRKAAQLALSLVGRSSPPAHETILFEPELIVRQSSLRSRSPALCRTR
jgi:LacI family transcriptional regulator